MISNLLQIPFDSLNIFSKLKYLIFFSHIFISYANDNLNWVFEEDMGIKILGFISGLLNGLFGSGGGLAAVPLIESQGIQPKKAHATSVALIFCLSIITALVYFFNGFIDIKSTISYIPGGIAGAVTGTFLLKRINNSILRRIFGAIMIISSIRIFIK